MVESSVSGEPVMISGERPFRVVARSVAGYIVMLVLTLIPPFVVFIPFIPALLFGCGVRNGRRAAMLALAVMAAVALALSIEPGAAAATENAKTGLSFVIGLILALGVPSLVVLPQIERRDSFGRVLLVAVIAAAIGLGATEVVSRGLLGFSPYHHQLEQTRELADKFITQNAASGPQAGIAKLATRVGLQCLPGIYLVDLTAMFFFSLLLHGRLLTWRRFQQQRGGDAGPVQAVPYLLRSFSLPDWLLFAFVLGGLSPFLSGLLQDIGASILAVTLFLYFLQGLAIFRFMLAAIGTGLFGSLFAFVILGLLASISVALLTIAGLFDSFFDFRHFNRKDDSNESHID
jgi:hypothetical protein